ncbi:DUF4402 domain-containing protein [Hydrogenovibrio kuenenii]|uniref:DUF4402 domain-containing protein n=1 Tax=Hydrogenovibrio kuenenii TaxID=63658 RepID=UPI00046357AD|nr:DUF4402 domain-containing protein [Hydrogenovibrio kuenenii]
MKHSYKKVKLALGLLAALGVSTAQAANTPINATASVAVNGAITLTKSADMNFGSIVATISATASDSATLALSPLEGAAAPSTKTDGTASKITILTQGTPAKFTIAGAGANSNILVTTNLGEAGGLLTLTNGSNPSADPLKIGTPTIYDVTNSSFGSFTSGVSGALQTDATGALEFNMGATITIPNTADDSATAGPASDGTYSGTFTVVANYQ